MKSSNLSCAVMRRVYYAYTLSILTHSMFWRGLVLGAAALLLARWLHVASIIDNFLSVPVGQVPGFVFEAVTQAATHGELLTVLTLVCAVMVSLSVGYQLAQSFVPRHWPVLRH